MRRWLSRLELRARRYAIPNLMTYIVAGMAVVFMLDLMGLRVSSALALDMSRVARGEVWRLISFVLLPPNSSLLFILFALYFYWMLGDALDRHWGSFRFNLFYAIGIAGSLLAALLTGYATNVYMNLSLFLAFAILYPEFELMIFFMFPIKIKYLAMVDVVFYCVSLVIGTWSTRAAILASLLNLYLFFGGDLINQTRSYMSTLRTRRNFRKHYRR